MKRLHVFVSIGVAAAVLASGAQASEMDPEPIQSVADFNGDGIVTWDDVTEIQLALLLFKYIAFYDRNADGALNWADVRATKNDLWKTSTAFDQEMAALYDRQGHLQGASRSLVQAIGWSLFTPSLKGHGEHWVRQLLSMGAFEPDGQADFNLPMGLNMATEGRDEAVGLYWGESATPLFNDPNSPTGLSTLDWPDGTAWMTEDVQAFGDEPPQFTSSPDEFWHTHGGLCLTTDPDTGEFVVNQYLSYAACQALPNSNPQLIGFDGLTPIYINIHVNTWMVHMWLYDLNPHGFFAGTHPDVDPNSLDEETINGGRPVPEWFQNYHHGH